MTPRSRPLFAGLFGSILFAFATTASAQQAVRGTVTDARSQAPIEGVQVADAEGSATVLTDANGRFALPCTGAMTVVASKSGYASAGTHIQSCSETVNLQLAPGAQQLGGVKVIAAPQVVNVNVPRAQTVITSDQLDRGNGLFLQDAMNLTPGVMMSKRSTGGGQRIIIRGYSADADAGNFVGTGYKAYINGIPVTDAEGRTVLDDIDFAELGRVDVIRGPASTIYGPGIGGVVNMYTAEPSRIGNTISQNTTAGMHGLLRSDTRLEHAGDRGSLVLSYGHQGYDSYRVNSQSTKDYGTFLGNYRPSDKQTISTYLNYAYSHDMRAGEMDSASFAQKLNEGEAKYIDNHARSVVNGVRGGITETYQFNNHVQTMATGYFGGNDLTDVSGAGLTWKATQNYGLRAMMNTDFTVGGRGLHGVTGTELMTTDRTLSSYGLNAGALASLKSDMATHQTQSTIFTQWQLDLPQQFSVTAGASLDYMGYNILDRMATAANPTHLDAGGVMNFDPVVMPRVAINKVFGEGLSVYADVSTGYSPPTASDAIIPYTGQANTGLKPESATQYEVGTKGDLQDGRLTYDVSLFNLMVKNKLTSQAVDSAGTTLYSYTVNSGDQSDKGLEAALSYAIIQDAGQVVSLLRPFVNYTYSDFTYSNFKSDNNNDANTVDYSGQHVVGVAPNVFNAGLDVEMRSGFYANVTYHNTGAVPVSYDNAHKAVPYSLTGAKIGYGRDFISGVRVDAFVGGDNLTNSLYYTQVFLNHKWGTPTPPSMYLPGPYKAQFYGGLKLSYGF